jgi:UDPglucose--hexose-1-phosphate uridylyltransferase
MTGCLRLHREIGNLPIYRRDHRKADGRMLYIYGRQPHTLSATDEDDEPLAQGGELRRHPLRDEWNIYCAHRQNRTFKPSPSKDPLAPTMPGSAATEIPFSDFELAVFENKFAALHSGDGNDGLLGDVDTEPARGACDVIVYSPQSVGDLHTIGADRRQVYLAALIDRYEALFAQGCQYVLPFENRGDEVGVTLHHPHGQIYGFNRIPQIQIKAIEAFANGFDLRREIVASMPEYGLGDKGGIAAFVPRFARFPYETWLAPMQPRAGPWDCTAEELLGLADWLGEMTRRYDALFQQPAATMMAFHAAPATGAKGYHFTVQFYPLLRAPGRVKYLASVEQHTGIFTVDVMPEASAEALRQMA